MSQGGNDYREWLRTSHNQWRFAFVTTLATLSIRGVRADEPPAATRTAQDQQIAQLIRQLGRDEYEERETVTKSLHPAAYTLTGTLAIT
jgi:hypothetical protein